MDLKINHQFISVQKVSSDKHEVNFAVKSIVLSDSSVALLYGQTV